VYKNNTTFISFLLIHYILKGGKILYTHTPKKIMSILNMFIYKKIYEKKKKKLQDIILVQMYEIVKIQMHFQSYYLIFLLNFLYRRVDFGRSFSKNEIYLFSFGKFMKK